MENTKKEFWKFAKAEGETSNGTVFLKDIFLKWAAKNSLKVGDARDFWKEIVADITMIDADGNYYKGSPEDIKEIQNGTAPLEPIDGEIEEQSDITEEMRDAIEEKKDEKGVEKQEEEKEELTLLDSLSQEEEESEAAPPSGLEGGELPEELPPLPTGSV